MSDDEEPMPWEGELLFAAGRFGDECADLRETNPYAATELSPPLNQLMVYLATELWDHGFSVTEIRSAFTDATNRLPRYASGYDRRGDVR